MAALLHACAFPLLYEPLKIYHHNPADDLVNRIIQHNIRAQKYFCTLSTDCTCNALINATRYPPPYGHGSGFDIASYQSILRYAVKSSLSKGSGFDHRF